MGDVLNYGKYYYSNHFSHDSTRQETFELFHWFGDPTMQIRTEVPEELNLEYPDAVYENQEIDILVEDSSGEPVRDAQLALRGDSDYYKVVETDLLGEASVEIDPSNTGEIELTATKANFIPSEGSIMVGESFTATNSEHEDAGRAYSEGWWSPDYYAEGSDDYLGSGSEETTLTKVSDGHYKLVEVYEEPEADFDSTHEDEKAEKGETIEFNDESIEGENEIVDWQWDFGDGSTSTEQNPTHSYEDEGTYLVKLTVTDSEDVSDSAVMEIDVIRGPEADFSFDPEVPVENQSVEFDDESESPDGEIVEWEWDFGDGSTSTEQNPTHAYEESGNYTVELTVIDDNDNIDTSTSEDDIQVQESPFTGGGGTKENPWIVDDWYALDYVRKFNDYAFVLSDDIDEHTDGYDELIDTEEGWEPIGDNDNEFIGSFDGQGYNIGGLYIERPDEDHIGIFGEISGEIRNLRVEDADVTGNDLVGILAGSQDDLLKNISVHGTVSGTENVGGLAGMLTGTVENSYSSADVSGENLVGGLLGQLGRSAMIDIGGDAVNTYSYGTVTGNEGVGGMIGGSNHISTTETSFWDVEASGQDTSADDEEGLNTEEMQSFNTFDDAGWNISDDGESSNENTWNIIDGETYPYLSWEDVVEEDDMEADFTFTPEVIEVGENIQFTDESSSTNGTIVEWSWDFGDGETSTEQHPTHVYDEAGDYVVKLNVIDDNELSDVTTEEITVEDQIITGPEAEFSFSPTDPEEDEEVQFTEESIEGDSEIVERSWEFGDGETSTEQHPTHVYDEAGDYTVELNVIDDNDLSDVITEEITVEEFTGEYCEVEGGDTSYDEYITTCNSTE